MSEYVVAIKESARRNAAAAGEWLNEYGPHRRFESKALAREWARELSGPHARLWVQDAPPRADDDADGYLVGVRRDRRRVHRHRRAPAEQADLEQF